MPNDFATRCSPSMSCYASFACGNFLQPPSPSLSPFPWPQISDSFSITTGLCCQVLSRLFDGCEGRQGSVVAALQEYPTLFECITATVLNRKQQLGTRRLALLCLGSYGACAALIPVLVEARALNAVVVMMNDFCRDSEVMEASAQCIFRMVSTGADVARLAVNLSLHELLLASLPYTYCEEAYLSHSFARAGLASLAALIAVNDVVVWHIISNVKLHVFVSLLAMPEQVAAWYVVRVATARKL